jgi:hypothetical protein
MLYKDKRPYFVDDTQDVLSRKIEIIVYFSLNSKHKDHVNILQILITERNVKLAIVSMAIFTLDDAHAINLFKRLIINVDLMEVPNDDTLNKSLVITQLKV